MLDQLCQIDTLESNRFTYVALTIGVNMVMIVVMVRSMLMLHV